MFPTASARSARTRPHRRLGIERLEARDVPAAALDPLATFAGDVTTPREPDWVQLQVQTSSNRVLLSFESEAADGSDFRPGGVRVFAGDGAHGWAAGPAGHAGFALREVSSGPFFARVAAAKGSTGAFDLAVGLAGDVTGDRQVTSQDLNVIRGLYGRRAGQDGFIAAADVNHNGMIGPGDYNLARRNLGESATVGPMTVDPFQYFSSEALSLSGRGPRAHEAATRPDITFTIAQLPDGSPMLLESFSWGVHVEGGGGGGGGGGAGRPVAHDLVVQKVSDANSPNLFRATARGTHFPEATLVAGRRGGSPHGSKFLEIKFKDVLISSYQIAGTDQGNAVVAMESLSLIYEEIEFTFYPTLPNGKQGDPITTSFDFVEIVG